MTNKTIKKLKLVMITVGVISLAIGFYFWEVFLLSHYLGGYDEYGLPVQLSYPGFSFFIQTWPLWVFPLLVLAVFLTLFLIYLSFKTHVLIHKQRQELMEKSDQLETAKYELEGLQLEYKILKQSQKYTEEDKLVIENFHDLEEQYERLKDEYEQSLEFIEKLLERIPPEK